MRFPSTCSGLGAALTAAAMLTGCANVDFDNKDAWFSRPFQFVSRSGGYNFSELQEAKQRQHPVTANDLVDGSGACPAPVAQQPSPAPPAAPGNQQPASAPPPAADSVLGGGIALGMTECEVVSRAGQPNSVQIGQNPNGDRTAVLTFNAGPRAGIYHFERGELMEMDGIAQTAPPPAAARKKSAKTQKKNDQT